MAIRIARVPTAAYVIVGLIGGVQLLDALTTFWGLSRGLSELNPVSATLISSFGFLGFVLAKLGFAGAISANVLRLDGYWRAAGTVIAVAVSSLAVASNVHLLT